MDALVKLNKKKEFPKSVEIRDAERSRQAFGVVIKCA